MPLDAIEEAVRNSEVDNIMYYRDRSKGDSVEIGAFEVVIAKPFITIGMRCYEDSVIIVDLPLIFRHTWLILSPTFASLYTSAVPNLLDSPARYGWSFEIVPDSVKYSTLESLWM